jgi:hypothetical protein
VSKKLNATQQRWPATKRELYALVWAVKRLKYYLVGRHFIARVDHKPLLGILRNRLTLLMEGWLESLMEFSFTTEYLPGNKNQLADALSRSRGPSVRSIEVTEGSRQQQMLIWEAERRGLQLLEEGEKRSQIIQQQHILGHFGAKLLSDKIRELGYWWPGMVKEIDCQIRACQECLRFNVERTGFHPAKSIVAKEPWDHIQIDLIGPLPESTNGMQYILTTVDVCTSYTVIKPLQNSQMETVARSLWTTMCDYGTPKIIQSDNGPEFANRVISTLADIYGVDHRLSTAYHPNTNGAVERKNRDVSQILRKMCNGTMQQWDEWLPMVQIALNDSISQRTASSAFSLMYGRGFNGFRDFSLVQESRDIDTAFNEVKDSWNEFKQAVLPGLEARTQGVKLKQENKMNERHQVLSLKSGSMVMARNFGSKSKWDDRYIGPYEVIQQHEGGAYSLREPTGEIMDGRFTIEQLKPVDRHVTKNVKKNAPGSQSVVDGAVRQAGREQENSYEVSKIVGHRQTPDGCEYLVRWKGYDANDDSWLEFKDFNITRPINTYWRKQRRELDKEKQHQQKKVQDSKQATSTKSKSLQNKKKVSFQSVAAATTSVNMPISTNGLEGSDVMLSVYTTRSGRQVKPIQLL